MTYEIIDNFLDKQKYEEISSFIKGEEIPWYYEKEDIIGNDKNKNGFFQHCFYTDYKPNSSGIDHINPLIKKIKPLSIIKIKANLIFRDVDTINCGYHNDNKSSSAYTAIFFLTNCNSITTLMLGDKKLNVESKENRFLVFKSCVKHKVIYPNDIHKRYVINFNFFKEE
tara:strand:- start:2553 stop:3059 length:507 start_codon:yes stop_codon:yes gene_type:complete